MVKHKHGKSYTPLVLPGFVELGMEQYHSLYKNLQYWRLVQKICLAVMKGLIGRVFSYFQSTSVAAHW